MWYEIKTKVNDASVLDFLDSIEDTQKKEDSLVLLDIFSEITWEQAKMWWENIVWFWEYEYWWKVCSWKWMKTAFSPRKTGLSIYIMNWFEGYKEIMKNLWKYKNWKSCLNIKKLDDIDLDLLKQMISSSFLYMTNEYKPCQK